MENEFPPNSHNRREERPRAAAASDRKEVRPVIKNKATLRKKPLYRKFLDAFRPEDSVGFVEYTLLEVFVPGLKDAVAEAFHGTIDNTLGTSRPRSLRGGSRSGYTSYNRMGSGRVRDRRDRDDDDRRSRRRTVRVADDVRDVIVDTRVEAEEVVDALIELASKWDAATMRDLLTLIDEPYNPTHQDWGWTDLRGARIHPVKDGYLIDLPRPEPLD